MLGFAQISRVLNHSFGAIGNIAEAADVSSSVLVTVSRQWADEQEHILTQQQDARLASRKATAPKARA